MPGLTRDTLIITPVSCHNSDAASSTAIDFRRGGQLEVYAPSGVNMTALAVWGSHDGTTWFDTGESITIAADEAKALPDANFACAFIAFVGTHTGPENVHVSIKG